MGDVRFLTHVLLRRAARARLEQLRRPRQSVQGDPVQQPESEARP